MRVVVATEGAVRELDLGFPGPDRVADRAVVVVAAVGLGALTDIVEEIARRVVVRVAVRMDGSRPFQGSFR